MGFRIEAITGPVAAIFGTTGPKGNFEIPCPWFRCLTEGVSMIVLGPWGMILHLYKDRHLQTTMHVEYLTYARVEGV